MLALTLIPAELWRAPQTDSSYSGFDPKLVYAANQSAGFDPKFPYKAGATGSIQVSHSAIDMAAPTGSAPALILTTTPLQRFVAAVDVTVRENQDAAVPFRLGLWSPWSRAGFFVVFGPAPQNTITAQTLANGSPDVTLLSGNVIGQSDLGTYDLGRPYHVEFVLDKAGGSLITRVSSGGSAPAVASVTSQQSPKLFSDVALSLSASTVAGNGACSVGLENFRADIPHQRLWASKIADPKVNAILAALAVAGVVLLVIAAGRRISLFRFRRRAIKVSAMLLVTGSVLVYLIGNASLFRLGGHPFDIRAEELYVYVARTYGIDQLYYLPNLVSRPQLWNGIPYQEFPFPYGPVFAYLSSGIGWLNSIQLGGGAFSLESLQLQSLIKAVNVLFGLADAVLIYLILRQIGTDRRWSLLAGALWLFNPAVWFSMSVWGQTHVISLFFILLAVLTAERREPVVAWLALVAGCLTRPQMLVFGLLIGIVLLRKFPWRLTLTALSWTVIVVFVALVPLTLATSPSLPVDILLNAFRSHETTSSGVLFAVSQDAYSVWPLIEYLTQGATGFHRAFNPSLGAVVGPLTFQRLSLILTLAAVLVVAAFLWFRRNATDEPGGYLPYVTLGITAFLMLLFGLVATHFLLALPLLLLLRRWTGAVAYFYIVVIWTVTTFVTMYGDMGLAMVPRDYPLLDVSKNAVTRFVVWLYTGDRFIFAGIVGNICAVIWLGWLTLRSPKGDVPQVRAYAVPGK